MGRHPVRPWIAEEFPSLFVDWQCEVIALDLSRTFWEKATILHAEYHRPADQPTPHRYARHYADVARLLEHSTAAAFLGDKTLCSRIADWKSRAFARGWARYDLARHGSFRLAPATHRWAALAGDYAVMRPLFLREPRPFAEVMQQLTTAEQTINSCERMTMPPNNFAFLQAEWPAVHEAASKAAATVHMDPRTACFYARRALELTVAWAYKSDASLHLPYQDNLSALIHEPSFKTVAGEAVFNKARVINTLGNQAVHSHRPIQQLDALTAVRELFHVGYWFARTYARGAKPAAGLVFDPSALPKTAPIPKQTSDQLQKLEAGLRERDEKLSALLADKSALDEELKRLRAEVAEAKKASAAQVDTHDYSEAETRDYFIDLLLKEAGWALDQPRDREFEVRGMPNEKGKGFVDYVLWGDDGRPLALVEAKRTRKSAQIGQQQAKLYADCLELQFGQRPVIFYSNGYDHWLWDDAHYPPRQVQGFFKKAELELMIQRRTSRKRLADAAVNPKIVERYYQTRAIRRIGEAFEKDRDRKALVVMATGAGKTRTVIALCDLLMQCNWVKRVLFLADRVALVNQAVNAFKAHLPDASPVNLVTEKDAEGRVFVSTYPTMMGLIDESKDGQRRFGVGHFDLIVIDEAHRSVYQKYRAIFSYFDALLVGLTATRRTRSTSTPTACSTSNGACRRTLTTWTKRSRTASWFRRRRCRCPSSSSVRASPTPSSPKMRRSSGTRSSGMKTRHPIASRPRRSTNGFSTRTPWTRCWST